MTQAVLEDSSELLNVHDIGSGMYDYFYNDRSLGGVSIWAPLKRKQLKIFGTYTKTFNVRLKDRMTKEERGLITKFLVLSRTRPNIDLPALFKEHEFTITLPALFKEHEFTITLPALFKEHEFTITPQALFASDGTPHHMTDKSALLKAVEVL